VISSKNAIESLNARDCRAVKAHGPFPNEQELPPRPATGDEPAVMSIGRLDQSGFTPAPTAVAAFEWPPGARLRAGDAAGRIVLRPASSGPATVTERAQLAVSVGRQNQSGGAAVRRSVAACPPGG
jgi:hypothetical protein